MERNPIFSTVALIQMVNIVLGLAVAGCGREPASLDSASTSLNRLTFPISFLLWDSKA